MSPLSLRRYRADRLLRRDFYGLRPSVLRSVRRRLAGRGISAEALDLEACYAQAWQGLYASVVAGEQIDSPVAWLVVVTFRRAIEDVRSQALATALPLQEATAGSVDPDLPARLDDLTRLRQVFEALRGHLSQRECEAASLCYLQGLSRAEAAQRMGISERRMRRLMEGNGQRPGVATKVGRLVGLVGRGGWCEEQSSLMRGLAFGLLDPAGERHRLALAHQRDCPACRAYVTSLRGLAAALPPIGIPLGAIAAGAGTVAGAGAGAGTVAGVGAGGAAGGGWLLAGGSLSAKLAAGCLIALGVGAGCVVLTSHTHGPSVAHAATAGRARARHAAVRPGASAPTVTAGLAGAATPPRAATTTATLRHRSAPAHREFGLEARSAGPAPAPAAAPVATTARLSTSSSGSSASPEPQARREFGPG